MGDDDLVGKRAQIGNRAGPEHFAALVRRAGEHEDVYAALAEAAARGGAIVVAENGAALRQVGLLEIILRQLASNGGEVCAQGVGDLGMKDVFAPEHGADGLLGEIIVGRAEAARGNDDVCAAARELQCLGETCGIVADDGVIEHVDAERGELLREHLRVRVGDVAEKDLGADGNEFSGVGHGQPPKSPTRTTAASAAANAKRQRSISGGRIHFARGFLFRLGSPRDPRSRGALAMLPRRISVPTAMGSAVWDMGAPYSLIRTRSRPAIARSHSASMSSTASSSRTSSTWGLVLGWRGVKTVQQSS